MPAKYTLKGIQNLFKGKYLHVFGTYSTKYKGWEFTVKDVSDEPKEGYLTIEQIESKFQNDTATQMSIEQTGLTPSEYQRRHKRAWNE